MTQKNVNWHKWPNEKPARTGEYLVRGVGGLNNKLHHYVCLWIGEDTCRDKDINNKFYYGGNEFNEVPSGDFEWLDLTEL